RVISASPAQVPATIRDLERYAKLARPRLRSWFDSTAEDPTKSTQRLHAAFALAGLGEPDIGYLIASIPTIPGSEAPNLIAALAADRDAAVQALLERFEQELDNPQ